MRRTKSHDKHVYKQVLKDCSEESHSYHGYYAQVEEGEHSDHGYHYGYHSDTSSESECYTYAQVTIRTETSFESFTEETYSTHEAYYTETETVYSYEGPVKEYYDDFIEKPCIKRGEEEYYAKEYIPTMEKFYAKVNKCIKEEEEKFEDFKITKEMKKEMKVVCDPVDWPFDIIEKVMKPVYGTEEVTYDAFVPYFETEKKLVMVPTFVKVDIVTPEDITEQVGYKKEKFNHTHDLKHEHTKVGEHGGTVIEHELPSPTNKYVFLDTIDDSMMNGNDAGAEAAADGAGDAADDAGDAADNNADAPLDNWSSVLPQWM